LSLLHSVRQSIPRCISQSCCVLLPGVNQTDTQPLWVALSGREAGLAGASPRAGLGWSLSTHPTFAGGCSWPSGIDVASKSFLLQGASPLTRAPGLGWGLRIQTRLRGSACCPPQILRPGDVPVDWTGQPERRTRTFITQSVHRAAVSLTEHTRLRQADAVLHELAMRRLQLHFHFDSTAVRLLIMPPPLIGGGIKR